MYLKYEVNDAGGKECRKNVSIGWKAFGKFYKHTYEFGSGIKK